MSRKQLFLIIGVFWLIVLGGFILTKEFVMQTGKEVLLKTVPVDPRDLFRGDYVVLRYDISRIDRTAFASNLGSIKFGDTLYVNIELDKDKVAHLVRVSKTLPRDGTLFLKGKVISKNSRNITIEYGIESYFVPEGKGLDIERNRGDIYAKVVIDMYGRAIIKSLVLNGAEIKNVSK